MVNRDLLICSGLEMLWCVWWSVIGSAYEQLVLIAVLGVDGTIQGANEQMVV